MDRTAGWVLASVALVAAAVLRVTARDDEHSTAWKIGGVIGAIAAGVLIGLALRFAYVKLIRKGHAVWSPWVLVIAAAVSFIVAASRAGERTGEEEATASTSAETGCAAPARTAEELTASLGRPWKTAEADPGIVDQVKGSLPEDTERVTARAVIRGGEPAAAVVVIEMPEGSGDEDELFAGFEEQANGDAEDASLGRAEARLYRAPDGGASLMGLSEPCAATLILGVSPRVTRELAGDLPVEG